MMHHPVGGPLRNSGDGERRVDGQRTRDDRAVGHVEPRVVPNLAPVVDDAKLRSVAHDAATQRMSRQQVTEGPAPEELRTYLPPRAALIRFMAVSISVNIAMLAPGPQSSASSPLLSMLNTPSPASVPIPR